MGEDSLRRLLRNTCKTFEWSLKRLPLHMLSIFTRIYMRNHVKGQDWKGLSLKESIWSIYRSHSNNWQAKSKSVGEPQLSALFARLMWKERIIYWSTELWQNFYLEDVLVLLQEGLVEPNKFEECHGKRFDFRTYLYNVKLDAWMCSPGSHLGPLDGKEPEGNVWSKVLVYKILLWHVTALCDERAFWSLGLFELTSC